MLLFCCFSDFFCQELCFDSNGYFTWLEMKLPVIYRCELSKGQTGLKEDVFSRPHAQIIIPEMSHVVRKSDFRICKKTTTKALADQCFLFLAPRQ